MDDIPHFTVHDLGRTCRTLLAKHSTPGHVAERCLNHKLKWVEGVSMTDRTKTRLTWLVEQDDSNISDVIKKLIDEKYEQLKLK